jgi:hypothetical protein
MLPCLFLSSIGDLKASTKDDQIPWCDCACCQSCITTTTNKNNDGDAKKTKEGGRGRNLPVVTTTSFNKRGWGKKRDTATSSDPVETAQPGQVATRREQSQGTENTESESKSG